MFDVPHRLHPAAIVIRFGTLFVASIKSMAVPLVAVLFSGGKSSSHFMALGIGLIAVLIGSISLVGPILHFFSTTFYIEGDALVISSGFVWRKRRTIPLARIQNVNVERTLWHRILGAAAVKVETAAGRHTEGDLTALSLDDANKLQAVLLQRGAAQEVLASEQKPTPLYELSPRQVLLAGALGNRALYIVASIFAVFQHEGAQRLFRPFMDHMSSLGPVAAILAGTLSVIALVVIGWLVSIAISATRFYGFRIEKHERGLLLTHGLVTQFRTVVPVGRIQDVRIVEPILFRLLGYCEIYADTAGSFDKKDLASANKICPILPEDQVSRVGKLLLPEFAFENLAWTQVSPKTVPRHAVRNFVAYAIFIGVPVALWLKWNALWFAIPLAIFSWLLGVAYYRYVGFAFNQDILVSRSGVFRKQAVVIPFDRIQHYTINASFFQRLMGLATVTAITASSAGHPIHIADMPAAAAESLRQTIGAAIRTHLGSRRGGL